MNRDNVFIDGVKYDPSIHTLIPVEEIPDSLLMDDEVNAKLALRKADLQSILKVGIKGQQLLELYDDNKSNEYMVKALRVNVSSLRNKITKDESYFAAERSSFQMLLDNYKKLTDNQKNTIDEAIKLIDNYRNNYIPKFYVTALSLIFIILILTIWLLS